MSVLNTYVSSDYLQDIADAIREINGSETEYSAEGMASAVRALTLSEISIPEEDETWTYDDVDYVVKEDENGVRELVAVADDLETKIPIPDMISVVNKPARRFYRVRQGDECNITVSTAGMRVEKIFGAGNGELEAHEEAEGYTISPETITTGGTHVITVSWSYYGINYTDTFTIDVLDENNIVLVTDTYLKNIAAAIRSVTKKRRRFRVSEMAQAIRSLRWKDDPNVVEKIPTRYPCLEITQMPDKVHYETYTGGTVELDYTGIVVSLLTADGERTDMTDKCSFFPEAGTVLTNSMEGLNTIAVTCPVEDEYGTYSLGTSFEINLAVQAGGPHGVPVRIRVKTMPDTTTFVIGKTATKVKLDYKGLAIQAVYKDGFTKNITNDCTIDPANGAMVSERDGTSDWTQKCTVEWLDPDTFRRFHTSFKLSIKDKNSNQSTSTTTKSTTDPTKTTQTSGGTTNVHTTPTSKKPKTTPAKKDTVTDLQLKEPPVNLVVGIANPLSNSIYPALVQAKKNNRWKNIDNASVTWRPASINVSAARRVTISASYKGKKRSHTIVVHGMGSYMNQFPHVRHFKVYTAFEKNDGTLYQKKDLYEIYVYSMWNISLSEAGPQYAQYYSITTGGNCTKKLMRKYKVPRGCGLYIPGQTSQIGNSVSYQVGKTTTQRYQMVCVFSNGSYRDVSGVHYENLPSGTLLSNVRFIQRIREL